MVPEERDPNFDAYVSRVKMLDEVGRVLAEASTDYRAVLDIIVRHTAELIGDVSLVSLLSEDREWLLPAAFHHSNPEARALADHLLTTKPYRVSDGVSGHVAKTGQAVRISEASTDEVLAVIKPEWRTYADRFSLNGLVVVPLRFRGKVIGTLSVARGGPGRPYTVDDQAFLQSLADRASMAIEIARLFEKLERDLAERKAIAEELRVSEARYRTIMDAANDAIFLADAETGMLVDANRKAQDLIGRSLEEIRRMHQSELHPPGEAMRYRDIFREHARRGSVVVQDLEVIHLDGHRIPVDVSTSAVEIEGKSLLVGIFRDATARKRAEQELRDSEEKYRTMVEFSNDMIWTLDRAGNFMYFNRRAEEVSGQKLPEWIGKSFTPLIRADQLPRIQEIFLDTLSGRAEQYEVDVFKQDGSPITLSVSTAPISAKGEIVGTVSFGRDITRQRQTEARIREQAALLDQVPDAVIVRDMEGRVRFWNRGAERLYGWSTSEAIGRGIADLLFKEALLDAIQSIDRELVEKDEWRGELEQVTKDGGSVTVESHLSLIRGETGAPQSVLFVNTDITERKKLEAQFLRSQRLESLGTLASSIAHDLNNVLQPILLAAGFLREKLSDARSQRMLTTLEASAKRGADIVKQVLTFARGIGGERGRIDSTALLKEMGKIAKETFPRSIHLATAIPEGLWPLSGDMTQLHQVLMNLSVNARDAMQRGGTLTLSGENVVVDDARARMHPGAAPGPYVAMTVSDTGVGIPPELADRIFEPFFTTKDVDKGTGLGLSTVHAIVKSHGGFVEVGSNPGRGSRFSVFLPATDPGGLGEVEAVPSEVRYGRGEVVLLVDDEAAVREIMKASLESGGYRVLTASNGAEAMVFYGQHREEIGVVLMDMVMPYLDGPAAIQGLRRINPAVKIIAMSGMAEEAVMEFDQLKVEGFLQKPYRMDRLFVALQRVLQGEDFRVRPVPGDTLRSRPARSDPES